jgi:hypothetical protein
MRLIRGQERVRQPKSTGRPQDARTTFCRVAQRELSARTCRFRDVVHDTWRQTGEPS